MVYLSPANGMPYSEAEALGSAIWLWMHSQRHQEVSVGQLSGLLLPAIKHGQFILATENGKPVFFTSWAYFSAESEREYLDDPQRMMADEDWHSGDRQWFIDWIAPFGHSFRISEYIRSVLFPRLLARVLSRPKRDGSVSMYQITGREITRERAREYFSQRPLV
ncbi:toxin-activating lysine-acyltransferase [Marinobacterium sp. D7]|uniref:toxin-activating lysine-acyltransferase n=1 Tax=Marinobacterium ramblicola TaxID=2849041 RepID=UPI001C2DAB65|nr:toxin-activating lysine-acyltransferase [Marinobacterium ramblicola]MBV1789261.1 toxin-activating lysine-acyltransferase [Marinobacterium ramblicola]